MGSILRILHLEDDEVEAELILRTVRKLGDGVQLTLVSNEADFISALKIGGWDLVLSDYRLPSYTGLSALEALKKQCPKVPFILVSGTIGEPQAIEILREGATDYVLKDRLDRLVTSIRRAIQEANEQRSRERAEQALRESEERFSYAFDHSPIGKAMANIEGRFLSVNDALCRMLGRSREDLLKCGYADVTFPDDLPKDSVLVRKLQQHELKNYQRLKRYLHADGHVVWTMVSVTYLAETTSSPAYLFAQIQDITEQKQFEESLERRVKQRTEELKRVLLEAERVRDSLDTVLKSISDGLLVSDLGHNVILMNRVAEDFLNVRLSEAIGRSINGLFPDSEVGELIRKSLDGRTSERLDMHLPAANAQRGNIYLLRTAPMRDRNGVVHGVVTIIEDVTQERELARLKTEFLNTAAHELRTPLTSIRGYGELLATRKLDESQRNQFLGIINRQATNLANIINDLLDLSRIESGAGIQLARERVNFAKICEDQIESFRNLGGVHQFEYETSMDPMMVSCDPQKMGQVVQNLLSNAVKYSPKGGKISLNVTASESDCVLYVRDEGLGMSPDQAKRCFDKFWRADASNTAIEGTGLGLSIVKAIVEQHGGTISVESRIGHGTLVRITLLNEKSNEL